jgi:hypothetical protein
MSTDEKTTTENDSSIYYVLGGVVLVAAIAGFFLLRPKNAPVTSPTAVSVPVVEPTPGPITKYDCGKMYYNQKIGFQQYYVSLEGVDTVTTGNVDCAFTFSVKEKTVATTTASSGLNEEPSRGGATFRCNTQAVELARGIPTHVEVKVSDPNKQNVICKSDFIFP